MFVNILQDVYFLDSLPSCTDIDHVVCNVDIGDVMYMFIDISFIHSFPLIMNVSTR